MARTQGNRRGMPGKSESSIWSRTEGCVHCNETPGITPPDEGIGAGLLVLCSSLEEDLRHIRTRYADRCPAALATTNSVLPIIPNYGLGNRDFLPIRKLK